MKLKSAIESILFIQGEPLAVSRLAKAVGTPKKTVEAALRELQHEYRERGTNLIANGDEWQLVTNPKHKELVEKFLAADVSEELSKAALEVLAIVAYQGPLSRATIDYIRGVDSSFSLRNLLIRGLVRREENPQDRRAYLYRISTEFLKYLGLGAIEELPTYHELKAQALEPPTTTMSS